MKFVTAFNGARDRYEVPLALHELGMLERHVSDLYIPEPIASLVSRVGSKLANRNRRGLPFGRVSHSLGATLRQLRLTPKRYSASEFLLIDEKISYTAARIARKSQSGLFLHNNYAYWAFKKNPDLPRWLYQYHPHAEFCREILAADAVKYPEVRASFESETDSQLPDDRELISEWAMADHVFCASSFTARSLIAQGCPATQISVVPYGLDEQPSVEADPNRTATCRFLFVGQGVQRKGLHHLLRVWSRIATSTMHLTIVARHIDPGLLQRLDQPGITYHSGLSASHLEREYATSDVFVLPSMVEGFGLVYLEALSHGLFCIGTHNTGLPDLNLSPEQASTIEAGELDQLEAALVSAAERFKSSRLDREAIRRAASAWTWQQHNERLKQAILSARGKL